MSYLQPHDRYQLVPIDRVPYAHQPTRCGNKASFDALKIEQLQKAQQPKRRRWFRKTTVEPDVPLGQRWYKSLSDADFERCDYHRYHMHQAQDDAQAIHASLAEDDWNDTSIRNKAVSTLPPDRVRGAVSLLLDPIKLSPSSTGVADGQQRVCALRQQGATHVFLAVLK